MTPLSDRDAATAYAGVRDPGSLEATDARVEALEIDVTDAVSPARTTARTDDASVVIERPRHLAAVAGAVVDSPKVVAAGKVLTPRHEPTVVGDSGSTRSVRFR